MRIEADGTNHTSYGGSLAPLMCSGGQGFSGHIYQVHHRIMLTPAVVAALIPA